MPTTEERRRLRTLGGSDIGAIMGVARFTTQAQVWDRIMGLEPASREEDEPTSGPLARGRILEPYVVEMWERETGRRTLPVGLFNHPRMPDKIHGHPDRWIDVTEHPTTLPSSAGILEAKVLGSWVCREVEREGLHMEYVYQLQTYLACTELEWGAFAVLNPDAWSLLDPYSYIVYRDEEMIRQIEDAVNDWWERYVVTGTRPPLTANDPSPQVRAHVGGEAQDWSNNPEWNAACLALKNARAQYDLALHAKKLAEDRVKSMMGEHEVVEGALGRVTWREGTRETVDINRLKQEHPEIDFERYTTTTTVRTFRPYLT